ncbi:MAG: hypothetical protein KDK40_04145 [Chlamydiia bacterium]|nr:hypothetical protein [Chlamydiia bacterium]
MISTPSSRFAVFDHLFKFKQLTTLCYITSSEYQLNCLLKEVKQLPLLLHLVLGGKAINCNTLYELSVDLSGVSSLETFGLTHKAQFKGPGVLKMIGRIQFWSGTLKRLTFSGAIVHSVGVVALICNALSSLEKLEALCLSYTDLDSGTVMNIVDKYDRYPWLKFLDFTGCQQTTNSRNFIKRKSAEFPNLLIKM